MGVISPNPTVERMVAAQYQARMYLSKLVSASRLLSSIQICSTPNFSSTDARKLKAIERTWRKSTTLKNSFKMAIVISAWMDTDRRSSILLQTAPTYE